MQYFIEVVTWLFVIEVIGFIALPIAEYLCHALPGRGYSVSKILGLLLLTYFSWILTHLGLDYNTSILFISLSLLVIISYIFYKKFGLSFNKSFLIKNESFFFIVFIIFLIIRSYSSDSYWQIGEKFMDMAFINSILRNSTLPPMDPWFSGMPMNYYYFGYLLIAALTKLTSTELSIGFNIASAIFFAISASAAFGIGFALTNKVKFGLITFVFVLFLGNLVGFVQMLVILFFPAYYEQFYIPETDVLTRISTFSQWPSVNVIPGSISEVPYHVYLIGDLHPNLVSISFQLLILALLLNVLKARKITLAQAFMLGLIIGFFYPLNTWDYPTYTIITIATVFLALKNVKKSILLSFLIVFLSYLLYSPYHLSYQMVSEVAFTLERTELVHYLLIFGVFIYIISCYTLNNSQLIKNVKLVAFFVAFAIFSFIVKFQMLLLLIPLLFLAYRRITNENTPEKQFVYLIILFGLLLSLFAEVFYIRDTMSRLVYFRFNTIFKLYIQAWILFGIAASYAIYQMPKKQSAYVAYILILMALVYPIFVTNSQSESFNIEATLDAERSIKNEHPYEYQAIEWLRGIKGTPVVLQAAGYSGTWNSHVSAFTGLPTVLGWEWHEYQWRMNLDEINARRNDVERAYTSSNYGEIKNIIYKYNIKYIYIGEVERFRYQITDVYEKNKEAFELVFNNRDVEIYEVK